MVNAVQEMFCFLQNSGIPLDKGAKRLFPMVGITGRLPLCSPAFAVVSVWCCGSSPLFFPGSWSPLCQCMGYGPKEIP